MTTSSAFPTLLDSQTFEKELFKRKDWSFLDPGLSCIDLELVATLTTY
jgi:hypothetical protein